MSKPIDAGEGHERAKALVERDYMLERAGQHRVLAEAARDTETEAVHRRFQQIYEDRARAIVVVDFS